MDGQTELLYQNKIILHNKQMLHTLKYLFWNSCLLQYNHNKKQKYKTLTYHKAVLNASDDSKSSLNKTPFSYSALSLSCEPAAVQ